jgi:hypothetical protein
MKRSDAKTTMCLYCVTEYNQHYDAQKHKLLLLDGHQRLFPLTTVYDKETIL